MWIYFNTINTHVILEEGVEGVNDVSVRFATALQEASSHKIEITQSKQVCITRSFLEYIIELFTNRVITRRAFSPKVPIPNITIRWRVQVVRDDWWRGRPSSQCRWATRRTCSRTWMFIVGTASCSSALSWCCRGRTSAIHYRRPTWFHAYIILFSLWIITVLTSIRSCT